VVLPMLFGYVGAVPGPLACCRHSYGFPFTKLLQKNVQIFAFVRYLLREKIALCAIIRKLHFAQNCAFPLLHYSVLGNFA